MHFPPFPEISERIKLTLQNDALLTFKIHVPKKPVIIKG